MKKVKREAAAQRRPARSERKNALFPRNDRPYDLERNAFQIEHTLETSSRFGKTAHRASAVPSKNRYGAPAFPFMPPGDGRAEDGGRISPDAEQPEKRVLGKGGGV